MTRPTSTDKADYALRAYAAGKTMRQVAAEIDAQAALPTAFRLFWEEKERDV